jgi:hypothetical protein
MPDVQLSASVSRGHVVVALRGELEVTGAAAAEAAIAAGGDLVLAAPQRLVLRLLGMTGQDDAVRVRASATAAVVSIGSRRTRYGGRGPAVSTVRPERAAPLRTGTG